MSNKQAKRIKTTYDHFSYKHIDYVREIHSTDTNIFRTVKRTIPTTLTWTSNPGYPIHWHPWIKQNQKHLYMCFHQTFSLDPLWFFAYSRIGSGHVIIWKTAADKYKPPSTTKKTTLTKHKLATNPQTCSWATCVPSMSCTSTYVSPKWILPGYNPMKFLAPFQDLLSISPFLLSTDIWSDGNEYMMDRVNLELANG